MNMGAEQPLEESKNYLSVTPFENGRLPWGRVLQDDGAGF